MYDRENIHDAFEDSKTGMKTHESPKCGHRRISQ